MNNEIPILGGRLNRGRLVRIGDFLLRPADEDETVEKVMIEVGKVFGGIPKTFGRDSSGRLKLEWIEGECAETFDEDRGILLRPLDTGHHSEILRTRSLLNFFLIPGNGPNGFWMDIPQQRIFA